MLLDLKVKAAALGISAADFPSTPVEDIILGWEAVKLKVYHASIPVMENQLSKLSPVSLGKAKREEDAAKKNPTKESAQEERDRKVGQKIVQEIRESTYFRAMPLALQGAFVREHGHWPGEKKRIEPIKGMSAQLAREITLLGKSGVIPDSKAYWEFFRRFHARLGKTAG